MNQIELKENISTRLLQDIAGIRSTLCSLIVLAASLTHQIHHKRDELKVVEDTIISEIWSNPEYKNDKVRNEQKHLARINDDRFTEPLADIERLELDRARCHADILENQNELQLATAQYQATMLPDQLAGLQFVLQPVLVPGADTIKVVKVQPQTEMQVPAPDENLPLMAATVLQVYLDDNSTLPVLAETDRKICDIVRSGETRFLDGAALQRVRDLYHEIPAIPAPAKATTAEAESTPAAAPVEPEADPANSQAPYLKETGGQTEKVGKVRI